MSPVLALALALALATATAAVAAAGLAPRQSGGPGSQPGNNTRDPTLLASYMAAGYQNGDLAPGAWVIDSLGQTVQVGSSAQLGNDSASQVPWCSTVFVGAAQAVGSVDTGWTQLPNVTGFDFRRDLVLDNATQAVVPYYIERKDWTKVKRAIVVNPGLARDVWSYMSLVRNSLICASANASMRVHMADVVVGGVAWMSSLESTAGAAGPNDVYFKSWSDGSNAAGPRGTNASAFDALDRLVDFFFNTTNFPHLNSVIVAGHSLGASFTQRYAVLRKPNPEQDPYMYFLSGNPGAYVEVTDQPAVRNLSSCQPGGNYTEWPYGLDSNIPSYLNATYTTNATAAKNATLAAFFSRQVETVCGLSDDGAGDTHPAAQCEGSTHLERCRNFQASLSSIPGSPASANHSFAFLQYTSHQDYKVYANPETQMRLFSIGLNNTRSLPVTDTPRNASSAPASGAAPATATASASPPSEHGSVHSPATALLAPWALTVLGVLGSTAVASSMA